MMPCIGCFAVVSRLLKHETLIFQDTPLSIQSFKKEEVSNKENSSDADDEDDNDGDVDGDNKGGSCKSHDSKEENESGCETKSKDDTSESNGEGNADYSVGEAGNEEEQLDDENLSQKNIEPDKSDHAPSDSVKDVSSDEFCSLGEDDVTSDTQHAEANTELAKSFTEGSTDSPKSHINLSHSNDNSANVSETDEEKLFEEQKNESMPSQLQTSAENKDETPLLPGEKLEDLTAISKAIHEDKTVVPTEMHKDEVKLSSEKVKLLKILSDAKVLSESVTQSVTNFDADNGIIILSGTTENIMNAKLALYENAFIMSNFRVQMRKQTSDLLFTVRGARWLEKEFQQRQINVVLYQKDSSTDMVVSDDNSYEAATKVLQEILAFKVIAFQDDHLEYLRSAIWKKSMEEFSAKEIIHISIDFKSSEITIEGHADSVILISENISMLLKTNGKVTKSIKLRKGSLRLLKERQNAVGDRVKDALK